MRSRTYRGDPIMTKTLLIDTEGGAGSVASRIRSGAVEQVRERHFSEVDAVFATLLSGERKADIVVIDPITFLQTFTRRDLTVDPTALAGQGLWAMRGALVTDKRDWGIMADLVCRELDMFHSLPEEGIVRCVILTALEEYTKDPPDPITGKVKRGPAVSPAAYKDVIARADVIARLGKAPVDMEIDG